MRILFAIITIIVLTVLVAAPALAYTLSEPIPTIEGELKEASDLGEYLSTIFNYVLGVAAVLAVIMIIIGGLEYMGAAGNTSVIENAKDRIWWAILGLILALSSVLILQTIGGEQFLKLEFEVNNNQQQQNNQVQSKQPYLPPDTAAR